MICADINIKLYFNINSPNIRIVGNKEECEMAFSELFDDIFIDINEYVRAKTEIQSVKEVDEE